MFLIECLHLTFQPRVQVNQQQSQQIPQQQTLVIGQQPTGNMNTANTQPTTQTQWPQQQTLTIQRSVQQPIDQRQVIWSQQSSVNYCFYFY